MTKLDEIALNIELVLISIIEAVALTFLAETSIGALHSAAWLRELPFILSGLTILLVFWSQAILHAVSFIRWPLRMEHMLMYFVAAFVQVVGYSMMGNVLLWFLSWSIFSIVALFIYAVDLNIIRAARSIFASLEGGGAYMDDVERRHINEFTYLVPLALAFNIGACVLAYLQPQLFVDPLPYMLLGTLQFLISLGALVDCVRNFHRRSRVLPTLFS